MSGVYLYIKTYKQEFQHFIILTTDCPTVCDGFDYTNPIAQLPITYEKGEKILMNLLNEGEFDHVIVWLDNKQFNVGECRRM